LIFSIAAPSLLILRLLFASQTLPIFHFEPFSGLRFLKTFSSSPFSADISFIDDSHD
jgi:hypothetical protein